MANMHNQEPEPCQKCVNGSQASLKKIPIFRPYSSSELETPLLSKRSSLTNNTRRSFYRRQSTQTKVTATKSVKRSSAAPEYVPEPLKDTVSVPKEPSAQDLRDDKLRRLKLNEERERDLERNRILRRFNLHKQNASNQSASFFEAQKLLKGKDLQSVNSFHRGVTFTHSGEPMVYKTPSDVGRLDSVGYKVHSETIVVQAQQAALRKLKNQI